MKTVLRLLAAFAVFASATAYGQSQRTRDLLWKAIRTEYFRVMTMDGKGKWVIREYERIRPEKLKFEPSHQTMRSLEDHFTSKSKPKDRITLGLLSIAENIGVDDIAADGVSWRDDDRVFGVRSLRKVSYRYAPRRFPHGLFSTLDEALGEPLRVFASRTLSF
jgi:hypothetical protein